MYGSEDSDQPAYLLSLIRIFNRHILDNQGCKASTCGHKDYADMQAN